VQQVSTEDVTEPSSARPPRHVNDVDCGVEENDDESLSVEVPPPDYTTYAFYHDTSTGVPADAVVNHVVRTAPRVAVDFRQNAIVTLLPFQTVSDTDEGIYEYVDDRTYLEPSPTYQHVQPRCRRVVTLPRYSRCQSYDVVNCRTKLPRGTLLLVDDDEDRNETGCDATRSVLALDRQGSAFYVPRTSLQRFGDSSGQPWYFPTPLSPHQASIFVAAQHQNGCFVVYKPAVEEISVEGRPQYVLTVGLSQRENQGK